MPSKQRSIVLIGMPGAGKSTAGILLAKDLGLNFVDTDIAIQSHAGKTLQDIIRDAGYNALLQLEQQVVLDIDCSRSVVATGGSVVYSRAAMMHLKKNADVVYLKVELDTLKRRIHNYEERGIVINPAQNFDNLFAERSPLYQQYCDICIDSTHHTPEQTTLAIEKKLKACNAIDIATDSHRGKT